MINKNPFSMKHCPICGKLPLTMWRPFCSQRCQQVDLHRWMTDVYTIPVSDGMTKSPDNPEGEE